MGKQTGIPDYFFVEDHDISGDVAALTKVSGKCTELNMTGIDKAAMERLAGIFDGEIDWNVMFDRDSAKAHEILSLLPYTDILTSYFHNATLGNPACCMESKQVDYNWNREATGMLIGNVKAVSGPTGHGIEWCVQLTAGKVTDASAVNHTRVDGGTAMDAGASSSFGLSAYVHLFSLASGTMLPVIQDSGDDITYLPVTGATLQSYTGAAPYAAQFVKTTMTQTIRRYVRFATTGVFTNAVVAAAFNRYQQLSTL